MRFETSIEIDAPQQRVWDVLTDLEAWPRRIETVETVELLKSIGKGRTMVVIDHDIDSLFELVERVTVLQEGRVLVEGTPDEIKRNAAVQEAYLGGVNGEMSGVH